MYGFIFKDLRVNLKNIALFGIGMVFFNLLPFAAAASDDGADENTFLYKFLGVLTVVSSFYILGMLETSIFDADERKKWAYYAAASEAGVEGQIGSKYIVIYLMSMFGVIWCNILNSLSIDLADNSFNTFSLAFGLFFIQIFLRAVDIPFIVAFSSKKGNNVRAVILIIFIFALAVYLLFGDLSYFGNSMEGFWDKFFKLMDANNSPKIVIVISLLEIAVIPLYYLSYRISCKYYLKGVDSYDK